MARQLSEKAFRARVPALPAQPTRGRLREPSPTSRTSWRARGSPRRHRTASSSHPSVWVILPNGKRLAAKVAKYSPPAAGEAMSGRDLALLRVEATDLPTVPLGESRELKIGDRLSIIGFPGVVMSHELIDASQGRGVDHARHRVGLQAGPRAINPSSRPTPPPRLAPAAGPRSTPAGEVVGVMTFVTQGDGGNVQGFNFIIPAAAVRQFLDGTTVALDESSRFNTAWQAGLRAFFNGQYSRATAYLAEANRLHAQRP